MLLSLLHARFNMQGLFVGVIHEAWSGPLRFHDIPKPSIIDWDVAGMLCFTEECGNLGGFQQRRHWDTRLVFGIADDNV